MELEIIDALIKNNDIDEIEYYVICNEKLINMTAHINGFHTVEEYLDIDSIYDFYCLAYHYSITCELENMIKCIQLALKYDTFYEIDCVDNIICNYLDNAAKNSSNLINNDNIITLFEFMLSENLNMRYTNNYLYFMQVFTD